jgi:hypothetical protein
VSWALTPFAGSEPAGMAPCHGCLNLYRTGMESFPSTFNPHMKNIQEGQNFSLKEMRDPMHPDL